MRRFRSLALAALIGGLAGCLSHGEYRHIYSLDGAVDAPMRDESVSERLLIQLPRVLIPDYLDTTDIVLRLGAHELRESAKGRFGERLSSGFARALRSDLASRLPQYTVVLARSARSPAQRILVNVDAFDVWPSGRCVLVADWSIQEGQHGADLSAGRGTFTTAAAGADPGDGAIVAAMADAVRQLGDRIASTVGAPSAE